MKEIKKNLNSLENKLRNYDMLHSTNALQAVQEELKGLRIAVGGEDVSRT